MTPARRRYGRCASAHPCRAPRQLPHLHRGGAGVAAGDRVEQPNSGSDFRVHHADAGAIVERARGLGRSGFGSGSRRSSGSAPDRRYFAGVIMLQIDPVFAIVLAGLCAAVVAAVLGPLLFRLEGPDFAIGSWVAAEALRLVCAQFKALGGGTGMSISPSDLSQTMGLKWARVLFGLRLCGRAGCADVLDCAAACRGQRKRSAFTAFVRSRMLLGHPQPAATTPLPRGASAFAPTASDICSLDRCRIRYRHDRRSCLTGESAHPAGCRL